DDEVDLPHDATLVLRHIQGVEHDPSFCAWVLLKAVENFFFGRACCPRGNLRGNHAGHGWSSGICRRPASAGYFCLVGVPVHWYALHLLRTTQVFTFTGELRLPSQCCSVEPG